MTRSLKFRASFRQNLPSCSACLKSHVLFAQGRPHNNLIHRVIIIIRDSPLVVTPYLLSGMLLREKSQAQVKRENCPTTTSYLLVRDTCCIICSVNHCILFSQRWVHSNGCLECLAQSYYTILITSTSYIIVCSLQQAYHLFEIIPAAPTSPTYSAEANYTIQWLGLTQVNATWWMHSPDYIFRVTARHINWISSKLKVERGRGWKCLQYLLNNS